VPAIAKKQDARLSPTIAKKRKKVEMHHWCTFYIFAFLIGGRI
jgi:hypothetical protein